MLQVLRIAPLSSVQDAGRRQWRALGVPEGGPLDEWSHGVANVLVGNDADCAALEIGFGHSQLRFDCDALIAVAGARVPVYADGQALARWRPVRLRAGCTVDIQPARSGVRCYLAVAGGLDSPRVMGSASALHGAPGFPGLLRTGQSLPLSPLPARAWPGLPPPARGQGAMRQASWWADAEPLLDLGAHAALRIVEGAHAHMLHDRLQWFRSEFRMSAQANRMAAPLEGSRLNIRDAGRLVSEPVVPGTIQLPGDGRPIILLADAQTVGGYPRVAHLAQVDLARLAQRPPGSAIRFESISIDWAQRIWCWRRERLARLQLASKARLCAARGP
ncbi:MAG: biotin-dependent carboxyltransferase family protein [Lysobacterales bacterium]